MNKPQLVAYLVEKKVDTKARLLLLDVVTLQCYYNFYKTWEIKYAA